MRLLGLRDRMLYLRTLVPFADLPPADLTLLANAARESLFRAGDVLLEEGLPVETIWLIVDGEVRATRRGTEIAYFGPSSAVGAFGMLARADEGVQAVARTDGFALCLDTEAVFEAFEDSFTIVRYVLRAMARTLMTVRMRIPDGAGFTRERPHCDQCDPGHLDLVQRIFMLRRTLPWGDSGLTALAQLARTARSRNFAADEPLWREGDPSTHMLVLASGVVACESRSVAHTFYFQGGNAVGTIGPMAELPRWYTATALEPTVALELRWEDFLDVLEDQVDLATGIMVVMAEELLSLAERYGIDLAPQALLTRPGTAS